MTLRGPRVRRETVAALLLVGYTLTGIPTEQPRALDRAPHVRTFVGPRAAEHDETGTRGRRVRPVARRASRGAPRTAPPPDPLLAPFGPVTDADLAELRGCENGGRYDSAADDRYRGAYQAWPDTWERLWQRLHRPAYAALDPAAAPRRVQDAFARWLHHLAGRGQWPVCGRSLP